MIMSYLVKIKTSIKNKEDLVEALENMGFKVEQKENMEITIWRDYKAKVDIRVSGKKFNHTFGFRKNDYDGVYELCADDMWRVSKDMQWQSELKQEVSLIRVKKVCKSQGFTVTKTNKQKDGTLHVLATQSGF